MKNLYLSLPIIVLPLIVFAQKGKHQEHNLPPTDPTCGHKPDIDLVIYNGLLAPYGGQEVPKTREKSVGAVTVANLNDTDADGTIDNEDNEVQSINKAGRNEIDLMKLHIRIAGVFPPTAVLELAFTGDIAFWSASTKGVKLMVNAIPVSTLPLTMWVEARACSARTRDISIKARVNGIDYDEVKATAIWVRHIDKYTIRAVNGENNYSPANLGVDAPSLIHGIDETFRSIDGSRYGLGRLGQMPGSAEDGGFGGRILLRFGIMPNDLFTNIRDLGITFDVSRRAQTRTHSMSSGNGGLLRSQDEKDFPLAIEAPNDDTHNLDEDNVPSENLMLFSFDAPSNTYTHISPGSNRYFGQTKSFFKRELQFYEFVRVSFDNDFMVGDKVQGSVCSPFVNWSVNYTLHNEIRNPVGPPYSEDNFVYNQLNSVPAFSPPKLLSGDQRGGIITCIALPNITTCSYFLKYAEATNEWNLTVRDGLGQPTINLGNFAPQITPAGRVWNITHVNRVMITITQDPAQLFSDGTLFLFDVFNDPVILNSMN